MNEDIEKELREIDKQIATHIFKYVVVYDENGAAVIRQKDKALREIPFYSSDLESSYILISHFKGKRFNININYIVEDDVLTWYVYFDKGKINIKTESKISLPHAICLAILKYIEITKNRLENKEETKENLVNLDFNKKSPKK